MSCRSVDDFAMTALGAILASEEHANSSAITVALLAIAIGQSMADELCGAVGHVRLDKFVACQRCYAPGVAQGPPPLPSKR